jgi:hypothetical protein
VEKTTQGGALRSVLFFSGSTAVLVVGLGPLHEVPRLLLDAPHSLRLLWTSAQAVTGTSTYNSQLSRQKSMPPVGFEAAFTSIKRRRPVP